jgi:hypothetical protein
MLEPTYKYMFLILILSTKGQKNPQKNTLLLIGYLFCGARIIGCFLRRSSDYLCRIAH